MVPRLWPDSTIVCLASGPSVTRADVDYCRGKVPVIAVNDGCRWAPWADVLYSSDQRWMEYYHGHRVEPADRAVAEIVTTFAGRKFGCQPLKAPKHWNVSVLLNTGERGIETDPCGVRTGRNSGYSAMNVARHLGAKRIVLVGYDMRNGKTRHFFGEHPSRLRSSTDPGTFIPFYQSLVKPLAQLGIEVVNCTPKSALRMFPSMSLAEALA